MIAGAKHPISDLPFVADRVPDDVNPNRRCFWSVKPTGDSVADCRTGSSYAIAYLRYERASRIERESAPFLPSSSPICRGISPGSKSGFSRSLITRLRLE